MIESFPILPFLYVIGVAFGSFFNVLIDRLPNEESILGRSHCDYCKKTLGGRDLIPVFSYFSLRGRCRYCKKKLSAFYPSIELLTGALFVLTWILLGATPLAKIFYLGIISTLIVIFFADIKYQIIPDSMQVLFIVFGLTLQTFHTGGIASNLVFGIVSGLIVMAPILLLFLVTRGRGMGFGDVKFAFGMGALLGWEAGLIALYLSFVLGGVLGAGLLLAGRKRLKSKIAFGPMLVLGTVILLLFRYPILDFVSRLF